VAYPDSAIERQLEVLLGNVAGLEVKRTHLPTREITEFERITSGHLAAPFRVLAKLAHHSARQIGAADEVLLHKFEECACANRTERRSIPDDRAKPLMELLDGRIRRFSGRSVAQEHQKSLAQSDRLAISVSMFGNTGVDAS
jgi:hypothetical protein